MGYALHPYWKEMPPIGKQLAKELKRILKK